MTLVKLARAKDFNNGSGFWQIPLDKESKLLAIRSVLFHILSAPELYQKQMSQILERLGCLCHIDNVLVFRATPEEHETCLTAALCRLVAAGVTLNSDKCSFYRDSIYFLGHLIDGNGVCPDSDKLFAILQMNMPSNVIQLR